MKIDEIILGGTKKRLHRDPRKRRHVRDDNLYDVNPSDLNEAEVKQSFALKVLNNIAARRDNSPFPVKFYDGSTVEVNPTTARKFLSYYDESDAERQHWILNYLRTKKGFLELMQPEFVESIEGNIAEVIRKVGDKFRLYSKKGKNLGTYDSRAGAEKREKQVNYFKHMSEGYQLQLERDPNMYVLHVTDTKTGKRTEVRGKSDYETTGYDANDKLHQLLDKLGKSANFAELMNGEVVTINPKHPHAAKAQAATDVAFNEAFDKIYNWYKDLFNEEVSVPKNIFHMKNRLLKVKTITDAMGNRPIMFRSFAYDAEPVARIIKKVTNDTGREIRTGSNQKQQEVLQKLGIENPTFAAIAGKYANVNRNSLKDTEVFGMQNIFIPMSNEIYYSNEIEDLGMGRPTGGQNISLPSDFDVDKAVATYKKGWPPAGFDNEIIVDTNEYYLLNLRSFLLELTSPEIKDQIKRLKNMYNKSYERKAEENHINDILTDLFKTKITTYGDVSRWIESVAVPFVDMLLGTNVAFNEGAYDSITFKQKRQNLNEETGVEMLKIFRTMHHDAGNNDEMDAFIKAHSWELRDFTPDMFPSEEEFFDYDDPFGRVIDIDYNHRVDLSSPIIVGPQYSDGKYSVIDGNHRAAAAQRMGKTIKGYFPVKTTSEAVAQEPDPTGYSHTRLTAPANTLVIDTKSDLDWYKLGQYISNLNADDPHEFGQSDSDMVVTMANPEQLKMLKRYLDKFGATYKEISGTHDQPEVHTESKRGR